jgi:hypothetical protein
MVISFFAFVCIGLGETNPNGLFHGLDAQDLPPARTPALQRNLMGSEAECVGHEEGNGLVGFVIYWRGSDANLQTPLILPGRAVPPRPGLHPDLQEPCVGAGGENT